MGHLFSTVNQPELAQTAYYMAHLKDPNSVGANSDLTFETVSKNKE